ASAHRRRRRPAPGATHGRPPRRGGLVQLSDRRWSWGGRRGVVFAFGRSVCARRPLPVARLLKPDVRVADVDPPAFPVAAAPSAVPTKVGEKVIPKPPTG